MNKEQLIWTEIEKRQVFDCRVFSVSESVCKSPEEDREQVFSVIDTKDWCLVVPVIDTPEGKKFVMVWQWRHGAKQLSLEFPGGVMEKNETPEEAGKRELLEETGYKAEKMTRLGCLSPNPAIMSNKVYFYLAEGLTKTGKQNLDEDEYVEIEIKDMEEAVNEMGKEPYTHALMATALLLYLKSAPNLTELNPK